MRSALIGHTGFVGSNLLAQRPFDFTYNSSNIEFIKGQSFDEVVCAGVRAVKWWANQNADEDRAQIEKLISNLDRIETDTFTLISTIDVFGRPFEVAESDPPPTEGLHAYGLHRLMLEQFVAAKFADHHIVRLPALFGTGLKKNAVFDLIADNQCEKINPLGRFQWYPVARLSNDLKIVANNDLKLVNFATEPITMERIHGEFFPNRTMGQKQSPAPTYNLRTLHAHLFAGRDGYILSATQVMNALATFLGKAGGA